MPIAYFPLEPDFQPSQQVQVVAPAPPAPPKLFEGETTECNYLVLMFVVGVLFIALTDLMKR
jgi:hypothetical protein